MPKRVAVGVVTSDKMAKTRRVEIPRLVRHPKYGKFIRRRTVCFVHDEENKSKAGDTVEIGFVALDPGEWAFHCHIQEHAEAGMMTTVFIRILQIILVRFIYLHLSLKCQNDNINMRKRPFLIDLISFKNRKSPGP